MVVLLFINDPFKVLDIPRNSSLLDIKRAYRQMSLRYHPDKLNGIKQSEQFVKVTQAYDELKNHTIQNNYIKYGSFYSIYRSILSSRHILTTPLPDEKINVRNGT